MRDGVRQLRTMPMVLGGQSVLCNLDGKADVRKRTEVACHVALFLLESVALEGGDGPSGRLRHTADKDDVLLLQLKAPAVGRVRKLEPTVEVLANVVDDVTLGLYVLALCGRVEQNNSTGVRRGLELDPCSYRPWRSRAA